MSTINEEQAAMIQAQMAQMAGELRRQGDALQAAEQRAGTAEQQRMQAQGELANAVALLGRHAASGAQPASHRLKSPDAPRYAGTVGAAIDDWAGRMEAHFAFCGVDSDDPQRVTFAATTFEGAAATWWSSLGARHHAALSAWSDLLDAMRGRFRPLLADRVGRDRLRQLRQGARQPVGDFIAEFQSQLAHVSGMDEQTQVDLFIDALRADVGDRVFEKAPDNLLHAMEIAVTQEAMRTRRAPRAAASSAHTASAGGGRADAAPAHSGMGNGSSSSGAAQPDLGGAAADMEVNAIALVNAIRAARAGDRDAGSIRAAVRCYRCGGTGHFQSECPSDPNSGGAGSSSYQRQGKE